MQEAEIKIIYTIDCQTCAKLHLSKNSKNILEGQWRSMHPANLLLTDNVKKLTGPIAL